MNGKNVKLGLIGLGTVGSGVVKLLSENNNFIRKKTGFGLEIKKIAVRDLGKERQVEIGKELLTTNVDEILEDKEIDVVIELIGGYEPAKNYILTALRNKKYVVTANKALLARHGEELCKEAEKNGVDIYFEASVAGGIPIILPLSLSLCANKIGSIHAILNGTCNYILTKMGEEGMDYKEALRGAQERGFAEADPALDVDGFDSMHKLVVLASLAFGTGVREKDVFVEGINELESRDLEDAKELGYAVKLLAIAKYIDGKMELRVHPAMIPNNHPLATVRNEINAITINGDFVGEITLQGKGAGSDATASAVAADIINTVQDKANAGNEELHLIKIGGRNGIKSRNIGEIESAYYIRVMVADQPGVFAAVSKTLAENNISIASIIQKERKTGKTVPIVLMTHNTTEGQMRKALEQINGLDVVKAKTKSIRVEKIGETPTKDN